MSNQQYEALYKGKRHYDKNGKPLGGIKVMVDDSYMVEVEGGEYKICNDAYNSDEVLSFNSKTNKEILDYIHGNFSCKFEQSKAKSGDFILCRLVVNDEKKKKYSGTVRQILDAMQSEHSCRVSFGDKSMKKGGEISPEEIEERWNKKKEHIEKLSEAIRSLRNNLTRDIKGDDEKERLTALAISVIDKTAERVGNGDSEQNGHFGVTGFQKNHIKVDGNTVYLNYVGKSGVKHEKQFSDELISAALKNAMNESSCNFVFCTKDGFRIKPDKINRYLSDYGITAKDIRGYSANRWIVDRLNNIEEKDIPETEAKRKRKFNKILKSVAAKVGHGSGTLKKHYMIPELETTFIQGGEILNLSSFYSKGGYVRLSKTPAPKSERIYGSSKNAPKSAASKDSGKNIELSSSIVSSILNKLKEHNSIHKDKRVTIGVAKAVVRRGMGAYSATHRPTIKGGQPNSRVAWGLARLNAFLIKAATGKSKSGRYSQDNDLLDELNIPHKKYENGGNFKRQVVGNIIYSKNQGFLFLQRADDCEKNSGKWHILSGGVEDGESLEVAAKREFVEEVGYNGEIEIEKLQTIDFKDYEFTYFLIMPKKPFNPKLDFENKDYKWVYSIDEMLNTDLIPELKEYLISFNEGFKNSYAKGGRTFNDKKLLSRYKRGEKIGFTAIAHLKSQGLIERADGTIMKTMSKGGLLAPNGKPSNLTPEQYKLVRTPEFKAWFGDWEKDPANASKIVDENGEPLVVYRGMPKKRRFGNIFNYNVNLFIENRKKNKFAFYFSRTKEEAEIYGFQSAEYNDDDYIVKEYFLKINNLFLAVKKDSVASKSKININSSRPNRFNLYDKPIPEIDKELGKGYLTFKELFDLAKPNKKDFELLNTEYTDNEDAKKEYEKEQERVSAKPIYWHFIDISKNDKKQDFWRNYLKDIKKYDGLMFYEDTHALTFTGRGKNEKAILQFLDNPNTICVFEPNQIKLADGTNTTFDGNNPDIRYAYGGSVDKNCIDFIKKTEAILKNGYYHNFGSFCFITYNSGNQKDLNVYQTVNLLLGKSLSELLKIDEESAKNLISNYYDSARRFDTLDIINELKGCDIIIADRDKIVCANNMQNDKGGEIENLISQGVIDLKFYETTPEHAKEYGIKAIKPIFVQNLCVSEKHRLKGIGNKVLKYIESYAQNNGNDVIFGYVADNAVFSKDSRQSYFCDADMVKNWLQSKGYAINDDNNDFHKAIKDGTNTTFDANLIAPNGKPSNLTPEQWHLVRTPEFKAWFGDWENDPENASKVVDDNGEPLVVWHTSPNNFNVFDANKSVKGLFHFGTIQQAINRLTYFIENIGFDITPYIKLTDEQEEEMFEIDIYWKLVNYILLLNFYDKNDVDIYFEDIFNSNQKEFIKSIKINIDKNKIKSELEKYNIKPYFLKIKKLGNTDDVGENWELNNVFFDGYIYLNTYEGDKKQNSFIAFKPNQIKLADGTNTTFDGNNPDIRLEDGGELYSEISKEINEVNALSDKDLTPMQLRYLNKKLLFFTSDKMNTLSEINNNLWQELRVKQRKVRDILDTKETKKGVAGYLNEKYVYHFTTIFNLMGIVETKSIGNWQELGHIISLTTNPIFGEVEVSGVKNWNQGMDIKKAQLFSDLSVKIVFDLQKIKADGIKIIKGSGKTGTHFGEYELIIPKFNEKDKWWKYVSWIEIDKNKKEIKEMFEYEWVKKRKIKDIMQLPIDIWIKGKQEESTLGVELKKLGIEVREREKIDVEKYLFGDKKPKYAEGGELLSDNMKKHISNLNELLKNNNAGSLKFAIKSIDDIISTETSSIDLQEYKTLQKEIKKNGVVPILIDESNSTIIDGNHRWKLLNKMGIKNIPVFELKANDNFWENDDLYMEFDYQYKNETPLISINEFYADGGSVLLAPNGKPSNLTPEQYKLVRTPEFKAWFGDWENDTANASKVVDENGEPLVVYHGSKSNEEFNVFKQSNRFEFIYFAKTKEYAWFHFTKDIIDKPFQLRPFFLNIRNLLNGEEYGFEKVDFSELKSFFYGIHELSKDIQLNPKSQYRFWEVLRFSNDIYDSLKNQDYYDGISFYENFYDNTTWNDTDDYSLSYVVMNPNQIKLADGSNTTFDGSNPDIRFDNGGLIDFSEKEIRKYAENILKDFDYVYSSYSDTNGHSMYFKIDDVKIRFSDHSVTNIYRINNEVLFNLWDGKKIGTPYGDFAINQNILKLKYALGDKSIIYHKRPMMMPSGKMVNAFGYSDNSDIHFDNGGSVPLAPNGKPSNLTPEQYKLVRTPEFKAWFGDWERLVMATIKDPAIDEVTLGYLSKDVSKVVDENGEPLIVYHTTSAEFNIFSKKKSKEGFFFAPQKQRLSVYNKLNINSYFLNLRNPSHEMFKSDLNYLTLKGYDGIMDYGHAKHLGNKNLYEIIAFEPNQIKLADGTNTTFDGNNPDIRYEKGGNVEKEKKEIYQKWKKLVNMTAAELENFYNSEEGKDAGLKPKEAKDLGIHYGRESARWIIKMKKTPITEWTPEMWEWAKRQINFNTRMLGNKGGLYDEKGKKTRKHTSLLIWGHNPEKKEEGGIIYSVEEMIMSLNKSPFLKVSQMPNGKISFSESNGLNSFKSKNIDADKLQELFLVYNF